MSFSLVSHKSFSVGSLGSSYSGPGDVVSGAFIFGGVRAYNAAYIGSKCLRIVKASDGSAAQDINIASNGYVDDATIQALGYAVKVTKVYDQSGNGRDWAQATLANMPDYSSTGGPNSKPSIQFTAANSQSLSVSGLSTLMTNVAIAAISKATATIGVNRYVCSTIDQAVNGTGLSHRATADHEGNSGVNVVANDGVFHAGQLQMRMSDDATNAYVDGTTASGTTLWGPTLDQIGFGFQLQANAQFMDGFISEVGVWDSDFNGNGTFAAMNTNMHNAYGGW